MRGVSPVPRDLRPWSQLYCFLFFAIEFSIVVSNYFRLSAAPIPFRPQRQGRRAVVLDRLCDSTSCNECARRINRVRAGVQRQLMRRQNSNGWKTTMYRLHGDYIVVGLVLLSALGNASFFIHTSFFDIFTKSILFESDLRFITPNKLCVITECVV